MKKLWGGRFEKDTDGLMEEFAESVSFDRRLYRQDVRASIAHAEMLQRCGLLAPSELSQLTDALKAIEKEIEEGTFEFQTPMEDVHMNIEVEVIRRAGDAGRKLHTARSRNDQVACDLRLWCRDAVEDFLQLLRDCQRALTDKADQYRDAMAPGLTHLQHAQPVLLAHSLLAYVEMLERDSARLSDARKRINISPLGACALAGTALPTDPLSTAEALGFDGCFDNSIDAVSDRDFVVELVFDLTMVAMHLSRMAEEWLIWATQEFDILDLDEAFCTGSSIMPQKKNPDALELIRGKCGRVYGDLFALLTTLKGLPPAYNRDMQEDKEALFDAADTMQECLTVMAALIRTMEFKRDRAEQACRSGHMDATALAEYLVEKGVPFRKAHEIVGRAVLTAAADGHGLEDLSLEQLQSLSDPVGEDVYGVLGARNCIERFRSHGSTAPAEVERQIAAWRRRLAD